MGYIPPWLRKGQTESPPPVNPKGSLPDVDESLYNTMPDVGLADPYLWYEENQEAINRRERERNRLLWKLEAERRWEFLRQSNPSKKQTYPPTYNYYGYPKTYGSQGYFKSASNIPMQQVEENPLAYEPPPGEEPPLYEPSPDTWEKPAERKPWEFQWGARPETMAKYSDRQKGESLEEYKKRTGVAVAPEHALWSVQGKEEKAPAFGIGDLPAEVLKASEVYSKKWGEAVTKPFRGETPYEELPWYAQLGAEFTEPVSLAVGFIFPAGKASKGANVLDDVVKLLQKGIKADDIFKALTETAQAGRKFSPSEAQNLIKTAEKAITPGVTKGVPFTKTVYRAETGQPGLRPSKSYALYEDMAVPETPVGKGAPPYKVVKETVTLNNPLEIKGLQGDLLEMWAKQGDIEAKRILGIADQAGKPPPGWYKEADSYIAQKASSLGHDGIFYNAGHSSEISKFIPRATKGVPPIKPPSGGVPPGGTMPPKEGFAGNIRLSKYPEALQPLIKEFADAHPDKVLEATRGVRTIEQTMEDAKRLAAEVGSNVGKWKPGQALNAEETTVLRGALREKAQAVYDLSKAITGGNDTSQNMAKLALALEEHAALQSAVFGVGAEAGRTLNILKQMAADISTNNADKISAILKKIGGAGNAKKAAKMLSMIDLNDPIAVNKFIRGLTKPSWSEYPISFFYNNILSGIPTHVKNMVSNVFRLFYQPVETSLSALIEAPLAFLQRRPRGIFFGEVKQEIFGIFTGIPDGCSVAFKVLKSGGTIETIGRAESAALKVMQGNKWLPITWPGRLLETADAFGFGIHRMMALRSQAYRIASLKKLKGEALINEVTKLIQNPTPELLKAAESLAESRLFRGKPGAGVDALMKLRNKIWPSRFFFPFLRTPSQLADFGMQVSPLGFLQPSLFKQLWTKSPEASIRIARWVIGSSISAGVATYVWNGNITGAPPRNPAQSAAFYREGKQPFSIKIGDTWYSYQGIEPFNMILGTVAAAVIAIQDNNDKDAFELAQQVIASIGQNFINQTYMEGLGNIFEAMNDPLGYGANLLKRTLSGFVPSSSMLRNITKITDPVIRAPEGIGEYIQAQIPGLSQGIKEKIGAFGETLTRETPYLPINITTEKNDPVDKELTRLDKNIGFVTKNITYTNTSGKSQKVILDKDQLYEYQKLAGKEIKTALDKLMKSSEYRSANDEKKLKLINRAIDDAREKARNQVLKSIGVKVKTSTQETTTPSTLPKLKLPTLKLPKLKI